jgi:hypothetical protein
VTREQPYIEVVHPPKAGAEWDGLVQMLDPTWPWIVTIKLDTTPASSHEILEIHLVQRGPDSVPITARNLRRLPIGEVKRLGIDAASGNLSGVHDSLRREPGGWWREVTRRPNGRWPDEHFQLVADRYREALERGRPPLNAITERWDVSRATASNWVREARRREHLGWPQKPGTAGATARNSPATA